MVGKGFLINEQGIIKKRKKVFFHDPIASVASQAKTQVDFLGRWWAWVWA